MNNLEYRLWWLCKLESEEQTNRILVSCIANSKVVKWVQHFQVSVWLQCWDYCGCYGHTASMNVLSYSVRVEYGICNVSRLASPIWSVLLSSSSYCIWYPWYMWSSDNWSMCNQYPFVQIGWYVVSMMCGSALSFLNPDTDLDDYVGAMMTLSLFSGTILLILGLLRMGFVASILSQTVITSFTAASAFNIAASQLKHFWGVSTNKDSLFMILLDIFSPDSIKHFNWYATIVGVSCMLLLYLMKLANTKYLSKYPLPVEVRIKLHFQSSCF